MKEETLRLEEKEKDARDRVKAKKEHEKAWEGSRDQRVTTWHDYLKGSGKKTQGVKPPKLKTNDEVGEGGGAGVGKGRRRARGRVGPRWASRMRTGIEVWAGWVLGRGRMGGEGCGAKQAGAVGLG